MLSYKRHKSYTNDSAPACPAQDGALVPKSYTPASYFDWVFREGGYE